MFNLGFRRTGGDGDGRTRVLQKQISNKSLESESARSRVSETLEAETAIFFNHIQIKFFLGPLDFWALGTLGQAGPGCSLCFRKSISIIQHITNGLPMRQQYLTITHMKPNVFSKITLKEQMVKIFRLVTKLTSSVPCPSSVSKFDFSQNFILMH